ncbi:MAG: MGMT family protein [Ignavibacteria bacterium]|nr:MGMT family protein [Ignavibacteria bacterium]
MIGSDGSMVGYAGELWRKHWLLEHEKSIAGSASQLSFL